MVGSLNFFADGPNDRLFGIAAPGMAVRKDDTEMKKKVARSIVELVFDYGGKLNDSMLLVRESAPDEEFADYRRAVGNVLASAFANILDPIFAEHPDLRPNRPNPEKPDVEDPTETPQ